MHIRKGAQFGFTLVETLLVVSMIAMIGLTLYATLSSGVKLWQRGQQFVAEEDISIFFDKIGGELRNSFEYSLIQFKGREKEISFPTLVRAPLYSTKKDKGFYADQIGRVEYYFDSSKKQLFRRQADYGQALAGDFDRERPLLNNIESVQFNYFYLDFVAGRPERTTVMDAIQIMVRIDVEFVDEKGQKRILNKIVALPKIKTEGA